MEELRKTKEVRLSILQAKSISLEENIATETELEKKIESVNITQFTNGLDTDELKKKVKKCMILLKGYFDVKSSGEASNVEKLWTEIKETLRNVPNIYAFEAISRELDWSNAKLQQLLLSNTEVDGPRAFEKQLLVKLHQQLIVSGIESQSQESRLNQIKSSCGEIVAHAANELDEIFNSAVNLSLSYDDEKERINDYLDAMLQNLLLRGKSEHSNRIVLESKSHASGEESAASNYEITVQAAQNIQNRTEDKINNVQHSLADVFQINQKLNSGKISMIHLIQELKASSKYHGVNRSMLNITQSGEDALPRHYDELQSFIEQPVGNFSRVSDVITFELSNDSRLALDDETALLLKHVVGDRLTMRSLLESMKQNIKMYEEIQSIPLEVTISSIDIPKISLVDFEKQLHDNREAIMEILDNIAKTNVSSQSVLRDQNRIYKASLSNVYKNFIPASKKFEGKSFKAFENDFNLYYRMIKE